MSQHGKAGVVASSATMTGWGRSSVGYAEGVTHPTAGDSAKPRRQKAWMVASGATMTGWGRSSVGYALRANPPYGRRECEAEDKEGVDGRVGRDHDGWGWWLG
jgi:hypothetical protein